MSISRRRRSSRFTAVSGQRLCWALALLACGLAARVVQTETVVPPSLTTALTAYSAGEVVTVVGQHWPAGELVRIQIVEDGNPGHSDTLHARADVEGEVRLHYVVPGHGSAQNFTLTGTSPAVTTPVVTGFTDAGGAHGFAWETSAWTTPTPTTMPWVRTDRDDYQPGQVARIAGGGWSPGELVTLSFAETAPEASHPPVTLHAVADDAGAIYAGFVLQPHDLGKSYSLTATSSVAPFATAATTFTDDTVVQSLPFGQNWTDTGLVGADDNWSGVAGIVGFRGDAMTAATGVDPQTVLADGSGTPLDVNANQTAPNSFGTGGIAEFQLANPVVALQGSGTARAPHLVLVVNTSGLGNINVAYNLRDIDGSTDNAIQPVALQYRVGASGPYTNVPAGFVADATTGPSLASLVTAVTVPLPAAVNNRPLIQIRIVTTDAVGADEWVGVDDISVTASAVDLAPAVQTTSPADAATGIQATANLSISFSEPVDVAAGWFTISCATSGVHGATVGGGPLTFTLDPTGDFAASETCTVTIAAASVTDQDADDPPDAMTLEYVFDFAIEAAGPSPGSVVISEIYGGGGNSGATLTNDFIEIFNRTGAAIDLSGWSVQYASATGASWQVTPLVGSIPAGGYYLIQEAAGSGGTMSLPTPDAIGTISMSATAGKIALVSTTTALTGTCPTGSTIVDFAGFGLTASCFEGSGPTPAPSNTTSVSRNGGGSLDTDNNASDFTAGEPGPRASADPAPTVTSTLPAMNAPGVALDANVALTFSEPVNVAGSWFTVNCASSGSHPAAVSGGPAIFILDPTTNFSANELCTVTVVATNITDQDANDPPDAMVLNYTFVFTTADVLICGAPATFIHSVQGSGLVSPMAGSGVTVEGVVVGDYQGAGQFAGYYVQEEADDADANAATSEGIFVFASGFGPDVNPGDVVRVRGTVFEFNGLTELSPVSGVQICSTGASVAPAAVSLPVVNLDDLERFEGMLVEFNQTLTATEVFNLGRFGEVSLSGAGRLFTPTAVAAPGAPALAVAAQNARSRIVLDDGNSLQNIDPTLYPQGGLSALNSLQVGDTLPGVTGVMDYRFANYRIQPVGPISFDRQNPRTLAPDPVGGNLKVASFNVLNFFNGDGLGGGFPTSRGAHTPFELARQKAKEVSALTALNADIVGLMEIENDAAPHSAIEELVGALNSAVGANTYAFINTGVIGTDEIKVALIYKPAVVTPVGMYRVLTTAVDPRFVDTLNRPTLAQTFRSNANGAAITVAVNHLKSKGSDCNAVGDPDTGDGSGNCNITRTNAAVALVDWLASDPTGSGDPDFLLIGDFNAYTFESPIEWMTNHGFANVLRQFGGLSAYSYVFNGESGYLDHGLASASLATQVTGAVEWHINPDEPTVLDYNVEFKTANQVNTFYDAGPYRSSDHDPIVIGINLRNEAPSADAGGPYMVNEGGEISLIASGSDPDGGAVTFAWDLNEDGTFETSGQTVTFSGLDGPATIAVRVRVTDGTGMSTVDSALVTVNNVPPSIQGVVASIAAACGQAGTLTVTFSDPALARDTYTVAVNWGDGTSSTYVGADSGHLASHSYAHPGAYTATVRVADEDGGTSAMASATLTQYYAIVGGGISQPLNQDGTSIFKSKSTIPLKIQVADCTGTPAGNLTVKVVLTQLSGNDPGGEINEPVSTSGADTTGFMRHTGSGQYLYNLSAKALPDPSASYRVILTIVETGQSIQATFGLKP